MACVDSLPPSSLSLTPSLSFLLCLLGEGGGGARRGVGFDHWQKVTMVRFLRSSTERFSLQLQPHGRDGEGLLISQQLVLLVSQLANSQR